MPGNCGGTAVDMGFGDARASNRTYAAYIGFGASNSLSPSIATTPGDVYDI